jgi:hypothetical protein
MVVVDHLKRIRHFTTRHCGSMHDARIFSESHQRANLDRNFDENRPRVLIGDEGYACSQIVLTPIRSDRIVDDHQKNYNKAHKRARVVVEHSFGILKKRFPALLYCLRCRNLENVQAIIGNNHRRISINNKIQFYFIVMFGSATFLHEHLVYAIPAAQLQIFFFNFQLLAWSCTTSSFYFERILPTFHPTFMKQVSKRGLNVARLLSIHMEDPTRETLKSEIELLDNIFEHISKKIMF